MRAIGRGHKSEPCQSCKRALTRSRHVRHAGTLQTVATECGLHLPGLTDAFRSPIVRAKHPALRTYLRAGRLPQAAGYLQERRAAGEQVFRRLLLTCNTELCPHLRDSAAREAFIQDVLSRFPILFLVPLGDVSQLVHWAEAAFQVRNCSVLGVLFVALVPPTEGTIHAWGQC